MKHLLTTLILLLCTLTVFAQKEKVTGPKKKPQTTTVPAKPKQQTGQPKQQKQQVAKPKQQQTVAKQKPRHSSVSSPSGYENGYGYVNLGLSVKWATMNVGASRVTEYGYYYAWGETRTKSSYDWNTYFDTTDGGNSFFKYALNKKKVLELSHDAAYANWGGSWRMPTSAEQDELREKCTWIWTTLNGIKGYRVSSKRNGNSIFLPAAGYRYGESLYDAGTDGDFWSSSLNTSCSGRTCLLHFDSNCIVWRDFGRNYGLSVRAVCQ